jgi:hypothetical protein
VSVRRIAVVAERGTGMELRIAAAEVGTEIGSAAEVGTVDGADSEAAADVVDVEDAEELGGISELDGEDLLGDEGL